MVMMVMMAVGLAASMASGGKMLAAWVARVQAPVSLARMVGMVAMVTMVTA